jgi:hypothetical protein
LISLTFALGFIQAVMVLAGKFMVKKHYIKNKPPMAKLQNVTKSESSEIRTKIKATDST